MMKKLSIATLMVGAAVAIAPAVAQATPILTIITPTTTITGVPLSVYSIPSGTDLSGTITGVSVPSSSPSGINEIAFASINLTNTTASKQTYTIDVVDNSFKANGPLAHELYDAIETFGGEVNTGTADMTFSTTAFVPNGSSATVTQTENVTAGTGGASFGTGQATSSPTLELSPGDTYTINSSMTFTLSAGASVNLSQLNYNGYSGTVPTGTVAPEPQAAALAMGGMLPLFFLKRRRTGSR
jgi:hypothetical protein